MWEVEFPKITELSCLLGGIFGDSVGKESTCNAGDLGSIPGFNPWVQKIPWRRERLPTTIFWPGEFHGLYRPWGCKESDTTERLSLCVSQTLGWGVRAQRRGWEDELSPGEASSARVEIALDTHSNRPGPRLPIYTTSITKLSKINLREVWISRWLSAL